MYTEEDLVRWGADLNFDSIWVRTAVFGLCEMAWVLTGLTLKARRESCGEKMGLFQLVHVQEYLWTRFELV